MKLPTIYFISDREEIKDIPIGVPYMYGDASIESYLVKILEYECLYEEAMKSGYPFDFKKILEEAGYKGLESFSYGSPIFMDYKTDGEIDATSKSLTVPIQKDSTMFKDFIRDTSAYVDISKLKSLNVFPVWLNVIEEAVATNIHNFAVFNDNMYNKKLEGMYGGIDLVSPNKNLIIIDISGSIPRAVSTTCLSLAKNLSESFYADILITGGKSTLYTYEEIHTLNIESLYKTNGMSNDQFYFKNLLTETERSYKTAIVFGDNDHPGHSWDSIDGDGKVVYCSKISDKDGKKLCKWKVDKLISLHKDNSYDLAGYSRWFEPKEVEKIGDWVKYLAK